MSEKSKSASFTVKQKVKALKEELEQVEHERAWISFFLLSAKQALAKAKQKLANHILISSEKEEDDDDISEKDAHLLHDTEREISTLKKDVDYWEYKLELAEEEYRQADCNLFELQITREMENTESEASSDEFEEFAMLKASFDDAWGQIGERLKSDLKECENRQANKLKKIKQKKSKLVDELEASRDENESYMMQIEDLEAKNEEIYDEIEIMKEGQSELVDELEASRYENESYKTQIEDLGAKYKEINDELEIIIEEKSKLVDELEASRDEKESYKMQIEDLEAKYKEISDDLEIVIEEKSELVDELEASRDEKERYKMQIEDLEAKYKVISDELDISIEEESKLVEELDASRDEKESYKMQIEDHEAKCKEISDELEIIREEKSKLVDVLEASRDENESYKMQIEDLKDELEIMKEEQSKLVDELEASRDEEEKHKKASRKSARKARRAKKALFSTRAENESYKLLYDKLAMTMKEERSKFNDKLEASRDEVKKSNKALEKLSSDFQEVSSEAREAKEALFSTRLENKKYKMQIDELEIIMKEEKNKLVDELENLTSTLRQVSSQAGEANDNYKMQIEVLKAKNEKNERMLNELFLGDWKLVEEEGQQ